MQEAELSRGKCEGVGVVEVQLYLYLISALEEVGAGAVA